MNRFFVFLRFSENQKFKEFQANQLEIDFNHFEINYNKVLGNGSFGEVYEGTYYKLPVAVKKLKKSDSLHAVEDFKNEVQTLM